MHDRFEAKVRTDGRESNDPWEVLVEGHNVAEQELLRATLEAHGIRVRVDSSATLGAMGPLYGAAVRPRMLVPRSALGVARTLAEDIVGPFDARPEDDDEHDDESPFRRTPESTDDTAEEEDDEAIPPIRRKSYAILLIVAMAFGIGPLFGLSHVYAGRSTEAGVLSAMTVLGVMLLGGGLPEAEYLLALVWVADLAGGAFWIAMHNRHVKALASKTPEAIA